jgi:hypothetical protein
MNVRDVDRGVKGLVVIVLAAVAAACELNQGSLLAPSDAIITVQPGTTFLAGNASTTVSVEVRRLDGSAVEDGTEIVIQASSGELDQQKLRTNGGRATVGYRAGTITGTVRITASSGSTFAEVTLRVGSAVPGSVSIVSNPLVLPPGGGDTELVATVSAANGDLVAGAPVVFSTTAGTLAASEVQTNDRGEARTSLRTDTTARVHVTVLGLEGATDVRVRLEVALRVSVTPAEPTAGEPATVSAAVTTSDSARSSGRVRFLLGDGQVRDMGTVSGTASASVTWAREGGYNLSAEFTDQDGFITRDTVRVNVRAKAAPAPAPTPGPTPAPTPVPSPGSGGGVDELDLRDVTFLHTDVSRWQVTSRVTRVKILESDLCIEHTKAGRWPVVDGVEGNPWVIARVNGRWYAATYEWLRGGQTCKGIDRNNIGPHTKVSPLDSWRPQSGETVGFMVSALARTGRGSVAERSNVVLVRWP